MNQLNLCHVRAIHADSADDMFLGTFVSWSSVGPAKFCGLSRFVRSVWFLVFATQFF